MKNQNVAADRPLWHSPQLTAMGNLRDFVRVGQANGKSKVFMDGGSACGNESMEGGTGPCVDR